MAPALPVLTLDLVDSLSKGRELSHFHLYGIFLEEKDREYSGWILSDETCVKGLVIKLCGDLAQYPKPKPGDIVRVHRASWDRITKIPIVIAPRNVIIWPAFVYDPTPITIAEHPTITDEDVQRRRCLETFFCSCFTKISNIKPMHQYAVTSFYRIAGRVVAFDSDQYGNRLLTIEDETGKIEVRVFDKQFDNEIRDHYLVAVSLERGDLVAITNAKLDNKQHKLNLSANATYGRSIRRVERDSILGVLLNQLLDPLEPQLNGAELAHSSPKSNQAIEIAAPSIAPQPPLRRSPRLNKQHNHPSERHDTTNETLNTSNLSRASTSDVPSPRQPDNVAPDNGIPKYTTIAGISKLPHSSFSFCDIAGQVRGQPNKTKNYNNWVFQLYDGSKIDCKDFFVEEVNEPIEGCITIHAYSAQYPPDTNQHVEVVQKLKEGDLVFIKNIKASWKEGKLKMELSANLNHGKSINMVDRDTRFGIKLLDVVTNPFLDELIDEANMEPQDSPYVDCDGSF